MNYTFYLTCWSTHEFKIQLFKQYKRPGEWNSSRKFKVHFPQKNSVFSFISKKSCIFELLWITDIGTFTKLLSWILFHPNLFLYLWYIWFQLPFVTNGRKFHLLWIFQNFYVFIILLLVWSMFYVSLDLCQPW